MMNSGTWGSTPENTSEKADSAERRLMVYGQINQHVSIKYKGPRIERIESIININMPDVVSAALTSSWD